jgi:hypothetical protein
MICLRCGYCCHRLFVPIVKDVELGPVEGNLTSYLGDSRCPHLIGKIPGEYSCECRSKDWYEETPCFQYGQVEATNSPCRTGTHVMQQLKLGNRLF